MRIIFAGTPLLAQQQLAALLETSHDVVAVYTQPDRPQGRGLKLTESPVKSFALSQGLCVEQPVSLKTPESLEKLKKYQPDLILVVAYGLLLPQTVLDVPTKGCINMHLSLLPRWRGAAPIQYAILKGDAQSGVTLMQMDKGLDTGDILYQATCDITDTDTAASLQEKLSQLGQSLLKSQFQSLVDNAKPLPQDNALATHAPLIEKKQAQIDFHQSATDIDRMIRAYTPWPLAYFELAQENIRIFTAKPIPHSHEKPPGTILQATSEGLVVACSKDAICITEMQFPGKKRMFFKDILNAKQSIFQEGRCLS